MARPTRPRASSPSSDVLCIDRSLSSSPELPEDPFANVVFGSQSRAAQRGEWVPKPASRTSVATSRAKVHTAERSSATANGSSSRTTRVSSTRPVSKPPSTASRLSSRPPAPSKGKGKAREADIIEISDDSDGDAPIPASPPRPLVSTRRGNVIPAAEIAANIASTSCGSGTTATRSTSKTSSRKTRPGGAIRLVAAHSIMSIADSDDEVLAATVTKTATRKEDDEARGTPMDVDEDAGGVDTDMDVDIDDGNQSDSTLEYVSGPEEDDGPARPPGSGQQRLTVPSLASRDAHEAKQRQGSKEVDAVGVEVEAEVEEKVEVEEMEKPFPDFANLCARTTTAPAASAPSKSIRENAVAGPSTQLVIARSSPFPQNAVAGPSRIPSSPGTRQNTEAGPSTSTANASPRKSTSGATSTSNLESAATPKVNTNDGDDTHQHVYDQLEMSAEDAAAVYEAMFGADEQEDLPPAGGSTSSIAKVDSPPRVDNLADAAQHQDLPNEDLGAQDLAVTKQDEQSPVVTDANAAPAPALHWGAWNPLATGVDVAAGTVSGSKRSPVDAAAVENATEKEDERVGADEVEGTRVDKGKGKAREEEVDGNVDLGRGGEEHDAEAKGAGEGVELDEEDGGEADVKGKGKERAVDVEEAPAAAANNQFTFTFPRAVPGDAAQTRVLPQHIYQHDHAHNHVDIKVDAQDGPGLKGEVRGNDNGKGQAVDEAPVAAVNNAFTFTFPRPGAAAPNPVNIQQGYAQNRVHPVPAPTNVPWPFAFGQQHLPRQQPQLQPMPPNIQQQPGAPMAFRPGDEGQFVFGNPFGANRPPQPAAPAPMPQRQAPPNNPGDFTFVFPRGAGQPSVPPNYPRVFAQGAGANIPALPRAELQQQPPVQPFQPQQNPFAPVARPAQQVPVVPQPVPAVPVQAPAHIVHHAQPAAVVAPAPPQPVPAAAPAPVAAPAPTRDELAQRAVDQVKEVLPDVEPKYLLSLINANVDTMKEQTAERILGALFEMEGTGGYPRVVKPAPVRREPPPQPVAGGSNLGVRAREAVPDAANKKAKVEEGNVAQVDYEDLNRQAPSTAYHRLSVYHLRLAFPRHPKNVITNALYQNKCLYAPTYLHLHEEERRYTAFPVGEQRPYRLNSTKYSATNERRHLADVWDDQFGEEWAWVESRMGRQPRLLTSYKELRAGHGARRLSEEEAQDVVFKYLSPHIIAILQGRPRPEVANEAPAQVDKGKQRAVDVEMDPPPPAEPAEEEGDIECGCCFGEYTFDKMVQCPEGHLFCADCVSRYASTKLGEHNASIVCMHSDGCKLPFPESELKRVLEPKLMALYARLIAQEAVAAAGLDDLEECPFCDWKCVIDAPIEVDRLFRCGNEEGGCGVVSCRECKKKEHLPKTCKEMEEDQVLDGQHAIEEAMTRALMRNCPNQKCKKAFVKETGCNKMTCPHCRTLSCYVCRQIIKGYDHFDVMPGAPANTAIAGRCKLWEDVEQRHANEVRAAAEQAARDLRRENPEIDHDAIKVDIPVVPPPAPAAGRAAAAPNQAALQQQIRHQQQQQQILQQQQHQQLVLQHQRELIRQRIQAQERRAAELAAMMQAQPAYPGHKRRR